MKEYTFEKEQLAVMIEILETHNTNQKPIKVKSNNFEDILFNSLSLYFCIFIKYLFYFQLKILNIFHHYLNL